MMRGERGRGRCWWLFWRFLSIPFLCLGSFGFGRGFLYVLGLGGCGNTGLGKPEGWFRVMDGMWMGWEEKKGSWLVGHSGVACARAFVLVGFLFVGVGLFVRSRCCCCCCCCRRFILI